MTSDRFYSHFDQSAAYVDGWVTAMKGDNSAIFKAAAQAQKAFDYIIALALPASTQEAA